MSLINKIKSKGIELISTHVGDDEFGNKYWEEKIINPTSKKKRRFVTYNGICEPSKIPSEWHSWIHYTCENPPVSIDTHRYSWQKIHLPNMTGTKYAYHPNKNQSNNPENRKKVSSDYQPYNPNKKDS